VGAGVIGTGAVTGWLGSETAFVDASAVAAEPPVVDPKVSSPDQALQRLMDGNKRFVERRRQNPNQDFARLTEVAQDQRPFAAILSCADSRVAPEILFDQGIGDLFVVRVAGNISSTEDIASEEFGLYGLNYAALTSKCQHIKQRN
jgi:carbonic anhydrase